MYCRALLLLLCVLQGCIFVCARMKNAAIFHGGMLRLHDNPVLRAVGPGAEVLPVYFEATPHARDAGAVSCLRSTLRQSHKSDLYLGLSQLFTEHAGVVDKVFYSRYSPEVDSAIVQLCKSAGVPSVLVTDDALLDERSEADLTARLLQAKALPELSFQTIGREVYSNLLERVPLPDMSGLDRLSFAAPLPQSQPHSQSASISHAAVGEQRALTLLQEYLALGESEFTSKHAADYISIMSGSPELRRSLNRLAPKFLNRGEVVSGLLSPLVAQGCLSQRLMVHARSTSFSSAGSASGDGDISSRIQDALLGCPLKEEAVRKHWHARVAWATPRLQQDWDASFSSWRGYCYRHGVMKPSEEAVLALAKRGGKRHAFVLLHGFGGSIDQYSGLARELSAQGHVVYGLDSQGFGNSEKPPLSFNQYTWRDHALEFISQHVQVSKDNNLPLVLCGNSIGGFAAASSAAVLGSSGCAGVVLFNSAGRILEEDPNPEDSGFEGGQAEPKNADFLFPPFTGPQPLLLSLFGKAIFALLQPNIKRTTEWLYPSYPERVAATGLPESILRDSADPGASEVIAAGGKLPPPRSMDGLFSDYGGRVLVAQGALDPLNDAKARANMFGRISPRVSVTLLPLGHCAMDEGPKETAAAIQAWLDASAGP